MVFRLGLCRNGMGAEWEMRFVACAIESQKQFLSLEPFRNDNAQKSALPGCGKQVDILCQQWVDSGRAQTRSLYKFRGQAGLCDRDSLAKVHICSELKAPAQAVADRFFDN